MWYSTTVKIAASGKILSRNKEFLKNDSILFGCGCIKTI